MDTKAYKLDLITPAMEDVKEEASDVFSTLDSLSNVVNTEIKLVEKVKDKVGQEQIHGILFKETLSWREIIYDLINSEQLDPWDIDISLIANKYLDKVRQLEEANFFVSSQVLLAAALLLRIKSEIILSDYIPRLDEILSGKKEEERKYVQERIELDEEIPNLMPRTPLPRFRKVTLEELMSALGQAINTENRRIKKVVIARQQEYETALSLPRRRININDSIKSVYAKLKEIFSNRENKLSFSELAGQDREDRIATFIPLLHLDNQQKVWLEQQGHFEEIWILLKHLYEKQNKEVLENLRKEVEAEIGKIEENLSDEEKQRVQEVNKDFENPIGDA